MHRLLRNNPSDMPSNEAMAKAALDTEGQQWSLDLNLEATNNASALDRKKQSWHPLQNANILSKIFACWMFGFLRQGNQTPIQEEDLFDVLPDDSSDFLVQKLESKWKEELETSKTSGKSPCLLRALLKAFGRQFMLYGMPSLIKETVLKMLQPLMLSRLVLYFSTDLVSAREAYLHAAGISLTSLLILICHHVSFFGYDRIGMRLRIAFSGLIYRKALTLNYLALGEATVGQLVNILSSDVNKFDMAVTFIHYVWIAGIQLVIVAALIWREIGVSCLPGVTILILIAPLQVYIGKLFSKLRAKTAVLTDARIRIMNEVISGIRVIKIYAWEQSFRQLVSDARREIRKIRHASYLRAFTHAFAFISPLLVPFPTFMIYAVLGNPVLPYKVYAVLALFYAARVCFTLYMPFGIRNGSECLVSLSRIKKFLLMEEFGVQASQKGVGATLEPQHVEVQVPTDIDAVSSTSQHSVSSETGNGNGGCSDGSETESLMAPNIFDGTMAENAEAWPIDKPVSQTPSSSKGHGRGIVVENVYCSWTEDAKVTALEDISFHVASGELLAVVGPVGCGKSSLLMALLGELPTLSGLKTICGRVGYVAQQPWILSGSLRENVLFGESYQPAKYHRVIKNCALDKDIQLLPNGDQTLVGERGVTLSGGQRARVSLARAMYTDADVYLLDDPLSAVDPAVARHLFQRCISEYLKAKPKILVTHQLQFLEEVDKILILRQGKIADYGTYRELQQQGVDFATLLSKPIEITPYGADEIVWPKQLRKESVASVDSLTPDQFEVGDHEDIAPEEIAVGTVDWLVYLRYFRVAAGLLFLILVTLIAVGAQALYFVADIWFAEWTNVEEEYLKDRNLTVQDYQNITKYDDRTFYISTYAILLGVTVVVGLLRSFLLFHIFITASKTLHNQMFHSIIRAPMQFFDTNPVGRVLNRFSKDISIMDELFPETFTDFLQVIIYNISVVAVISVFNPFCLAFTLPLIILFVFTRRFYLTSSREVKRLESIARSPIFSHLSATLTGLTTVRAFRAQRRFTDDFDQHQDNHTKAWFLVLASARWFGVHLELFNVLFITGVCFACVIAADVFELNAGIVGLSLTYALSLMAEFQWAVQQSSEVENQMTSVERVCQYIDIDPEAPLETDQKPPADWPKDGRIVLEGVSLAYNDTDPLVLRDISCCIMPEEKIGIVGRTGAGKSSLMTALMRLAEPTGAIMIDGVNISEIGLHDLRKKVSFIPQDPVLFSGTLRRNLDPFDNHHDADIWRAIEQVELKPAIEELPEKLQAVLTEGGTNFSVGQRQLLCLARAILLQNKILIVDEATANVDIRTDGLIQATISERFKQCTVLTIAHRLNTIMDSDRVLVLDEGRLIEFDEPYSLLQRDGIFAKMVHETGQAEAVKLLQIAKEKFEDRKTHGAYAASYTNTMTDSQT